MSEPVWLIYTGAISGVIGAITGIAGAVMGYVSYRRTEDIKALDLRIELQKAEADLRQLIQDLPSHLDHAKRSRNAISSATGRLGSGALKKWLSDWDTDVASANQLIATWPAFDNETYQDFTHQQLEKKLLDVHIATKCATKLHGKYTESLAADEKDRDHLKEDQRSRVQSQLGKAP